MFKSKDAVLNFIYSMGAAVVIFGALVKMTHLPIPGVSGNFILGLGLAVECFIFIVFAFNPPAEETKYAWENVYPELLDANATPKPRKAVESKVTSNISELEVSLSSKLDKMLADAKLIREVANEEDDFAVANEMEDQISHFVKQLWFIEAMSK